VGTFVMLRMTPPYPFTTRAFAAITSPDASTFVVGTHAFWQQNPHCQLVANLLVATLGQ
jgi:hypothetical protein